MKYAFIALVVLYLITYGCSPDSSEKATESHEQTAPAAVEHAPQSEMVAAPEQLQETVVASSAEQHAPAPAEPEEVVEAAQQPTEVAEQTPSDPIIEVKQVIMPCGKMMALSDISENTPCLQPHWKASQDTTEPTQKTKDLATALQRMIDTTNEMVLATKQLVDATRELLDSGKEIKESTEVQQETAPAKQ